MGIVIEINQVISTQLGHLERSHGAEPITNDTTVFSVNIYLTEEIHPFVKLPETFKLSNESSY